LLASTRTLAGRCKLVKLVKFRHPSGARASVKMAVAGAADVPDDRSYGPDFRRMEMMDTEPPGRTDGDGDGLLPVRMLNEFV